MVDQQVLRENALRSYYRHHEERLERMRLARLADPEKARAYGRDQYAKHREARNSKHREWIKKNTERLKEYGKNYRKNNRELVNKRNGNWLRAHPEIVRQRELKKMENPQYRFAARIRHSILERLEGKKKSARTIELIGCSIADLRVHLEAQFLPGMSWENHGYWGWHIDHVKPCSSFDLTDPAQQRVCFNWRNLQPLWRKDNQSKGKRMAA